MAQMKCMKKSTNKNMNKEDKNKKERRLGA
jgi:hypothetical protein